MSKNVHPHSRLKTPRHKILRQPSKALLIMAVLVSTALLSPLLHTSAPAVGDETKRPCA